MSDQLSYKDEQWNELPVPEQEASWQKMELLLEKDKKRRLPFWWWRYAALGLLVAGTIVGSWLWFGSDDGVKESASAKQQTPLQQQTTEKNVTSNSLEENKTSANKPNAIEVTPSEDQETKQELISAERSEIPKPKEPPVNNVQARKKEKTNLNSNAPFVKKEVPAFPEEQARFDKTKKPESIVTGKPVTVDSLSLNNTVKKDSAAINDSIKKAFAEPIVVNDEKAAENKKKSLLVWSAGVGLQQPIAMNGQQSSSFNYKGKENSLADHIPSVYLRVQQGKWFAQGEFHFAIPQPVDNFYFSQRTRYDAASTSLNTERFVIQKMYYHQLPFSANYHLLPNLSVGAGGVYNILAGAVTEQEIQSKNVLSGTETTTRTVAPVRGYQDSFLYKTTAGLILQTDYHWKGFSLGLRFTQNLQPFIKYTKPDGTVFDEKNNALQAILRFRLWRSK